MNRIIILFTLTLSAFTLGRTSQDDDAPDTRRPIHLRQGAEQAAGFAQAYQVGKTVYVSATAGKGDSLGLQLRSAYQRITSVLEQAGGSAEHVVKETIYTTDMTTLIAASDVRKEFYGEHLPASSFVGVERLLAEAFLVEVELVVELP